MGKKDKEWFVNAPGSPGSPPYGSRRAAKGVAKQVRGGRVSKDQPRRGYHGVSDGRENQQDKGLLWTVVNHLFGKK